MLAIWSVNYLFAKVAVREAGPWIVVSLRTVLSGAVMLALYGRLRGGLEPGVRAWRAADVPRLLAVGVLGIVGNQVLFVTALGLTSVAHASVVVAMGPILVLAGAALRGEERITARGLGGLASALCGVAVLQLGRSPTGHASLAGDLVMLASSTLFAGFSIFGKGLARELGTVTLNAFAFVGGAALALPFALAALARGQLAHLSAAAWSGIAYMSICPSIVGYLIYAHALRHLPASRVASLSYLQPVLATLLAMAFLGEQPGAPFAAGAALVLGGVWAARRR